MCLCYTCVIISSSDAMYLTGMPLWPHWSIQMSSTYKKINQFIIPTLLIFLFPDMVIVCQSWVLADLRLPSVCVWLYVLLFVCVSWPELHDHKMSDNRHICFKQIHVISTLCVCWALADWATASLFISTFILGQQTDIQNLGSWPQWFLLSSY